MISLAARPCSLQGQQLCHTPAKWSFADFGRSWPCRDKESLATVGEGTVSDRNKRSLEVSAPFRARASETAFAGSGSSPPHPPSHSKGVAREISTVPLGEGMSDRGSGLSRTSAHCSEPVKFLEIFAEGVAHVLDFLSQLCLLASRRAQRALNWEWLETARGHERISLFRAVNSCCGVSLLGRDPQSCRRRLCILGQLKRPEAARQNLRCKATLMVSELKISATFVFCSGEQLWASSSLCRRGSAGWTRAHVGHAG